MDLEHYMLSDGHKLVPLPRPGRHPVLTWQFNLTLYPPVRTLRWKSVLREPQERISLFKGENELESWSSGAADATEHCVEMIKALGYISGMGKGI